MRIEQIEKLLAELGELLDLKQITAAGEEPSWLLVTRQEDVIHVDFEQETSRLYLSTSIGKARPEDYGLLLTYSSLWKETLGLYCALEGAEGDAILVFVRVASYLHPPRFAAIIEDVVSRAAIWRQYLARSGEGMAEPPLPEGAALIRV
jgi:Tir chaperone protein (CesT) family